MLSHGSLARGLPVMAQAGMKSLSSLVACCTDCSSPLLHRRFTATSPEIHRYFTGDSPLLHRRFTAASPETALLHRRRRFHGVRQGFTGFSRPPRVGSRMGLISTLSHPRHNSSDMVHDGAHFRVPMIADRPADRGWDKQHMLAAVYGPLAPTRPRRGGGGLACLRNRSYRNYPGGW